MTKTYEQKVLIAASLVMLVIFAADMAYSKAKHSELGADLLGLLVPEAHGQTHPLDLPKTDENLPSVLEFYMSEQQKGFDAQLKEKDPCAGGKTGGVCGGQSILQKLISFFTL